MELTVEELMTPRYKVIADYPFNPHEIGSVIIFDRQNQHGVTTKEYDPMEGESMDTEHIYPKEWFDKYPHLFRRLEWWEERKAKDMPTYLKTNYDRNIGVYKVLRWDMSDMIGITDPIHRQGCAITLYKAEFGYFPATKEEYEAYLLTLPSTK